MKKILLIILGLLLNSSTTFARVGGGQDYTSGTTGGSSGSSFGIGSILLGGGSLFGLIGFGIVCFVVYLFLKKAGIWGNVKNTFTNNGKINPLNNTNVQNDLRRGNFKAAALDASIGAASATIFAGLNKALSGGLNGNAFGAMGAPVDINAEIMKIKSVDPGFNEQVFKDKAQNAFYKLQEGWEKQDLTIMRPFVSDSVLSRFTNQLADMKSRGEKNIIENMVIGSMDISDVRSDTSFNYITVKIDASSADYTVNSQGQMIKGSKDVRGFTEHWIFLRTVGVKTDANKQLKDNKCPNCGAALQVNATGKCEYCGAVVTSGQYDWVLSEIRQG